jgi:hypothetical protein
MRIYLICEKWVEITSKFSQKMTSLKLSKHRAKIIRTKFNIVSGIFGGLGIVVFAV